MDRLNLLVATYYDYQKGRISFNNRLNRFPKDIREQLEKETVFERLGKETKGLESLIVKEMEKELQKDEIYNKFLSKIHGIGVMMAGDLIAWLCRDRDFTVAKSSPILEKLKNNPFAEIENVDQLNVRVQLPSVLEIAKHPSDIYKYCGLIPDSRKVKGKTISYNPKLKTHFWKITKQIIMAKKSRYVFLYKTWKSHFLKKYKDEYDAKIKEIKSTTKDKKEQKRLIKEAKLGSFKMKAHLTALKKMQRHLALTLYLIYKHVNNQRKYLPYPVEEMKHHTIELPFIDGENGKPEYLDWLVETKK